MIRSFNSWKEKNKYNKRRAENKSRTLGWDPLEIIHHKHDGKITALRVFTSNNDHAGLWSLQAVEIEWQNSSNLYKAYSKRLGFSWLSDKVSSRGCRGGITHGGQIPKKTRSKFIAGRARGPVNSATTSVWWGGASSHPRVHTGLTSACWCSFISPLNSSIANLQTPISHLKAPTFTLSRISQIKHTAAPIS